MPAQPAGLRVSRPTTCHSPPSLGLKFQEAPPTGLRGSSADSFQLFSIPSLRQGSSWAPPVSAEGPPSHSSFFTQSDGIYDFLSAEEKACLLFLEAAIGSLDTETDSGLSTDESEPVTTPQGLQVLPQSQPAPKGKPDCLRQHLCRYLEAEHIPLATFYLCSEGHGQEKD